MFHQDDHLQRLTAEASELSETDVIARGERMRELRKTLSQPTAPLPFPIDAFPPKLAETLQVFKRCFGTPAEHYGLALLTAAGAAIGNAVWVTENGKHPPLLYSIIVAPPGSGKTPILDWVVRPFKAKERQYRTEHSEELREYSADTDKDDNSRPPSPKELVIKDFTVEAAYEVLSNNPRGVIVVRDEGIGWIKSMNQYKQNGSEQEFWLECHTGGSHKVNRRNNHNGRAIYIPHIFASVLGGTQPGLLAQFAEGDKMHNGFLARILFAFPPNMKKAKYSTEYPADIWEINWDRIINRLLSIPCRMRERQDEFDDFVVDPILIPLSAQAKNLYRVYYDQLADKVNEADDEVVKATLTKFDSHVLRIALILHFLYWAEQGKNNPEDWTANDYLDEDYIMRMEISAQMMEKAINVCRYFEATGLRVVGRLDSPASALPDNKKVWYESLPEEVETGEAIELGEIAKISARTVQRMLKDKKLFRRMRQGVYEKLH